MSNQRFTSQLYPFSGLDDPVERVRLIAWPHRLKPGYLLGDRNDLCTAQFFCECITFHVIGMFMTANYYFDVLKFETKFLDRVLYGWNIPFEIAVHKNVASLSGDQKGRQRFRTDIIDIVDNSVRWKLPVELLGGADVAPEQVVGHQLRQVLC